MSVTAVPPSPVRTPQDPNCRYLTKSTDLRVQILTFLSMRDVIIMERVCTQTQSDANSELIWRQLLTQRYMAFRHAEIPSAPSSKLCCKNMRVELVCMQNASNTHYRSIIYVKGITTILDVKRQIAKDKAIGDPESVHLYKRITGTVQNELFEGGAVCSTFLPDELGKINARLGAVITELPLKKRHSQ